MDYQHVSGLKYRATTEDGSFCELNLDHWLQVKRAREQQGLSAPKEDPDHPIFSVGMTLAQKHTLQLFVIESITLSWLGGYYYTAVIRHGDNYRTMVILENIDSILSDIKDGERSFIANYEIYNKP